jgi:dolichol-phosphate mannosyltransferase
MQTENISIVIPTYIERHNINELLERVNHSIEPLSCAFEIIIVDDNSPGERGKVASQYSGKYPVRMIRRRGERGLGTGVLSGIKAANYNIIVLMSADLQYPPEKIPDLISCVQNGADIAIASRSLERDTSEDSSFLRRMTFKGADLLVRTLFREIRNIKDVNSGFFAFRKDVIKRANLNPTGDNLLLEILVQGDYDSVSEVNYEPGKRDDWVHKEASRNTVYYLAHVSSLFLRSGEFHRFLKFCAVGAVGAVLNLIVLYSLTELGVFYLLSGLIAIEAGLLSNFFLNKSWTFKDRGTRGLRSVLVALYRDHAVRLVGIVLNLVILWLLTSVFGLYYLTSQLVGIGVATLWNYTGNQWWTWETV